MPTVAIIDAYSLLYRAFFALPPLTNKQGEVTNAAYGFTTMLFKLMDDVQPDYVVVAQDMPAATFRHDAYDGYKAHRAPMPDAMRPQIPMMREVLAAMDIPVLGVAGYEADDVIGTLARRGEAEGIDVVIVTGDRDAFQLIDDHTHVLINKKGMSETVIYDRAAVMARYGVTPEQLADVKALTGDASDNIPGVPGVGDKTAGKLIAQYGTLDHLLEHLDEVKGKVGQTLAAHVEQIRQAKHLATIHTDVPLEDFSWDCCHRHGWDQAKLLELFRRLDFRSLLHRVEAGTRLVEEEPGEAAPARPVRVVTTPDALAQLARELAAIGAVTLVPVSDQPDPVLGTLVGLAISAGADIDVYVPLHGPPPAQGNLFADEGEAVRAFPERLAALRGVLEDPAVRKVGHNLKLAALWLRGAGLHACGLSFDSLIAGYCIDPTQQHTLPDLALTYLRQRVVLPELTPLWAAGDEMAVAQGAGEAAQLIRRLEAPMRTALAEYDVMPLFRDLEMPLIPVLAEMEWRGMALNAPHLDALSAELGKTIHQIEGDIYRMAGEVFTINSPKQLQTILFEKLGLPKGRKTKTGYSTDAETLAALAEKHDIVQQILTYRELTKLKSTYVDSLPRLVNPRTGRIHTHFNQAVTTTGRLSSSDPNLQNIPIRSPEGREIRRALVPGEPGWVLLAADYSQIELRVLAHITQDAALIEVFRRGEDLHTATACRVFGVAPAEVTRDMRRMAKVVNFSIPYGTTAFGLAGQLGAPRALADELMRTYLERFPGVATYMHDVVDRARRDGEVRTVLGRRRPVPDLNAAAVNMRQAAERTAINTPIQGSAADIMKLAMLRLARTLAARTDLHAHLLLQVHDEVVLETPAAEVDALAVLVRTAMQEAYRLDVPLEVDVKVGPNWRDVSPRVDEAIPPDLPGGSDEE